MRIAVTLAAAVAAAACGPSSAPSQPDPEAGVAQAPPEQKGGAEEALPLPEITLNLEDARAADVLRAMAGATRKPIVIDPDAQAVADCAKVSVMMANPAPAQAAIRLVGEALQPSGLILVESSAGGFIVRRAPGAPLPASCASTARPDGADPLSASAVTPPARATPDPEVIKKIIAGIRAVSETQLDVTEQARDLFFEHAGRLSQARIVPAVRDGAVSGLRLFGIRKDDIAAALGLKNGDLLIRVGGRPVGSPDLALEAYAAVRRAPAIEVQIEREGKPKTLTYRIVAK